MVMDGTGADGFAADVAMIDGRIRVIRDEANRPSSVHTTFDATGKVVCPGFIDLHSHSGLMILAEPRHEPKVRQGVTTEIVGVDGNAYAPFRTREDLDGFVELNAWARRPARSGLGLDSVASYLDRFDRGSPERRLPRQATRALRIDALGWDDVPADRRALDRMRGHAARGHAGRSLRRLSPGSTTHPAPMPRRTSWRELTAEAAKLGGIYHTHVRYALGDRFLDPFREAIEIGARGGGPVHITHFYHRSGYPGRPEQMIELVEEARAEGLDVTWDTYPYEWASTRLLISFRRGSRQVGRCAAGTARRLARPRPHASGGPARASAASQAPRWADIRLGYFATAANMAWEGRTLAEYMAETGSDAVDAICDLLLAEDLRVAQVTSGPAPDALRRFAPSAGNGRDRLDVSRCKAISANVRLVSRGSWASSCARSGSWDWRRLSER